MKMNDLEGLNGQEPLYLINSNGDEILLSLPERGLKLHNVSESVFEGDSLNSLPKESLRGDSIQRGIWEYWNQIRGKKPVIKEYSIRNNGKYLFIGNLLLFEGQEPNPRNARYVLKPFFVTGKMKEEGLKHLDN